MAANSDLEADGRTIDLAVAAVCADNAFGIEEVKCIIHVT